MTSLGRRWRRKRGKRGKRGKNGKLKGGCWRRRAASDYHVSDSTNHPSAQVGRCRPFSHPRNALHTQVEVCFHLVSSGLVLSRLVWCPDVTMADETVSETSFSSRLDCAERRRATQAGARPGFGDATRHWEASNTNGAGRWGSGGWAGWVGMHTLLDGRPCRLDRTGGCLGMIDLPGPDLGWDGLTTMHT